MLFTNDYVSLSSSQDTILHGAQAKGKTIVAHIGLDPILTNTQDNNHTKGLECNKEST